MTGRRHVVIAAAQVHLAVSLCESYPSPSAAAATPPPPSGMARSMSALLLLLLSLCLCPLPAVHAQMEPAHCENCMDGMPMKGHTTEEEAHRGGSGHEDGQWLTRRSGLCNRCCFSMCRLPESSAVWLQANSVRGLHGRYGDAAVSERRLVQGSRL